MRKENLCNKGVRSLRGRPPLRSVPGFKHAWLALAALCLSLPPGTVALTSDLAHGEGLVSSSRLLTLDQAVARALAHNHGLAAQKHAAKAAAWGQRQAQGRLLPSLSLESGYTRLDDETVARANAFGTEMTTYFPDSTGALIPYTIEIPQMVFRDGYYTSLSASLLLFNPSVWNAASLASASRKAADSQLESTLQRTVYETLRSFVELLKIDSLVRIQEEHLSLARDNREQAERLFKVGRYAEADVLRWRVQEVTQGQYLVQHQSARRVAALALENLMGDTPLGSVAPDTLLPRALIGEIEWFCGADASSWDAFMSQPLDTVIAQNPDLRTLHTAVRMAELEHRHRLISFFPSVTVGASYGWQENSTFVLDGEKTWAVSANIKVPLFTGFTNISSRQVSKYNLMEAKDEALETKRSIFLAAEIARTAMRNYVEKLRLGEARVASARRNYEIRKSSFDLGRLSNLEWLDAYISLQAAKQSSAAAYYDLILAVADYYQATGKIMVLAGK
ncbi:MAG: TolC family protein [Candidatus Eisenbacteria sp.]|nr:TolC family protein [Candidatus Eisenbacteria bacterium]